MPTLRPWSAILAPLVLVLAGLVAPTSARAQAPLALEVRGGAFVPVAGFRTGPEQGGRLGWGPSFGLGFALERSDGLHLLLGFSQHRVDCADDGCGGEGEYVSTAWDLGARLDMGSGVSVPWVRLGLTFPRVERNRPEPFDDDVTSLGLGAEAGAGVRLGVAGRFHLSPGIRFGLVDADLPSGGTLRMRYLAADVGLVVGF
jgi:hypothetical protein